jgi:hypothetical protein
LPFKFLGYSEVSNPECLEEEGLEEVVTLLRQFEVDPISFLAPLDLIAPEVPFAAIENSPGTSSIFKD